ncbi:MAG: PQQ-dependent dehydrogenase, methanol/ethanol family [Rhodoferax sp.]
MRSLLKDAYALVALGLMLGFASSASAQNWPVYGGDSGNTRFSHATQVTPANVKNLKVAWALQLGTLRSQESTPIVIGDTMYVSSSFGPANVFAVNAKTGVVKWRYQPDVPPGIAQYACCDVQNRGVAYNDGKIFVGMLDAHVVALDANTGKKLWDTKITDYTNGSVITSPPTLIKNLVITGYGGGEYGARGSIVALDQATGKEVWRTYTVPLPGEPNGDTWKGDSGKNGGGAAWFVGSYDPKLNLVYYGTSNPSPWAAVVRGSDTSDLGPYTNLYTSSVLALDPDNGKIVWHYQYTPHDAWDYDGVNELVFADLPVHGKKTPVLMSANRNGFFYVLDRATGKLVSAEPFVDANWATKVDLETGRPVEVADSKMRPGMNRKATGICPSLLGGKNWEPMSYDQTTGLVYIPTLNLCQDMEDVAVDYKRGSFYLGNDFKITAPLKGDYMGSLLAWNPTTSKAVWQDKNALPWSGGVMTTASGLVFQGNVEGWFKAYDAKTGKELWKFNSGSGISAAPMTYTIDGKQYVAVVSGRTESIPAFMGDIGAKIVNATAEGGTLYVFSVN